MMELEIKMKSYSESLLPATTSVAQQAAVDFYHKRHFTEVSPIPATPNNWSYLSETEEIQRLVQYHRWILRCLFLKRYHESS